MTISTPRDAAGVDALVAAADPLAATDLRTTTIEAALDDLGLAILQHAPSSSSRRRRPRARPVALIAVLVLGLGVAAAGAAALFVNAHTGRYPRRAWEVQAGGPGEALNVAGTNFRQVAAQVTADIPFPAGYGDWRGWVVSTVSPSAQTCPGASTRSCVTTVSVGALRGWVAMGSFCAWTVDWRQALRAGDVARARRDAGVIGGVLDWRAVRAEDPRPAAGSLFGWILPYLPAVGAGQLSRVDALLTSGADGNRCWSADPGFARRIDSLKDPGAAYLAFLDRGRS
jgi:hypothetical protein